MPARLLQRLRQAGAARQHGSPAGVESGEDGTLTLPGPEGCVGLPSPSAAACELKGQTRLVNEVSARVLIQCLWLIPPPPPFQIHRKALG